MNVIPIPFNSPLYPLPADYGALTVDGQRLARVNASRQWLLDEPVHRAHRLIHSTRFFDLYYLHPDGDFDPLFYDMTPLPTPSMHWDLSRMWANHRFNVSLMPRGGAKSTHLAKDTVLRIVTSPTYSIVYATSTHENARAMGERIRDQAYLNPRVNDDFSAEYGNPMKPGRGEKSTGCEHFFLTNGSWVRCVSAESRLRGIRPRRFRLDDPEYDEKASTSMAIIRQYMEALLFRIAIPMTTRSNCGIDWVGTFVSKRHFLWHAMLMQQTPDGPKAADPRFDFWARLKIDACYDDPETGRTLSCWPEMWPATVADKLAMGRPDALSLEELERILGTAAFNGEMRGRPGTSDEQFFKVDLDPKGSHAYWFEQADEQLQLSPRTTTTLICYKTTDGSTVKEPLPTFLGRCHLFITVDTAYTESASSDRRCCGLMAVTSRNELFVMDLWSDRKPDQVLIDTSFSMAQRWRCPLISVEVVKESFKLFARFQSLVKTKLTQDIGLTHVPAVRPIRPGTMSKTAKIESLDVRFTHNLIKLPVYRRSEGRWWSRLFDQIEGFNPEVADGGLEKDDELDVCFEGSTLIHTREGLKPISTVTTSDEVLTRFGWRRVLRVWMTGRHRVVTRFGLTGTPGHPVWTENRGWVSLQDLSLDDTVMTCLTPPTCSSSTPSFHGLAIPANGSTSPEKPSFSTVSGTTATPNTDGGIYANISGLTLSPKSLRSRSTWPSMCATLGPSQQDSTSTTATATLSTTIPLTSRPSTAKLTSGFIRKCVVAVAAARNTLNTLRSVARKWSKRNSSALGAKPHTGPTPEDKTSSAPRPVEDSLAPHDWGKPDETRPLKKPEHGVSRTQPPPAPPQSDTEKPTPKNDELTPKNTWRSGVRPTGNASGKMLQSGEPAAELCETWNLTVDEHPEFFANGILVHNCAMSLFVLKSRVREAKKPDPVKPIDPIQHARDGHLTMEGGVSTLALVPLDMYTADDLNAIMSRRDAKPGHPSKV